jgi:hypothetical protein
MPGNRRGKGKKTGEKKRNTKRPPSHGDQGEDLECDTDTSRCIGSDADSEEAMEEPHQPQQLQEHHRGGLEHDGSQQEPEPELEFPEPSEPDGGFNPSSLACPLV